MSASVIDPGTWDDEWFGQLSDREMLIWIGVFGRLRDDQGRFVENAALARARLFPYRDIAVADVQKAFDRFVADGRLHRYRDGGRTILQIVTWWEHQRPQWATASALPSPEGWTDRVRTRVNGSFCAVNWDSPGGFARDLRTNSSPEQSSQGAQLNPSAERSPEPFGLAHEPEPEPNTEEDLTPCRTESAFDGAIAGDFDVWWTTFGRIGSKADALALYRWWRKQGASADDLLTAARRYRAHCISTDCRMQHARTFLAKKPGRWVEWAAGEEHGSMDAAGSGHLKDVLAAGALAFGLNGGRHVADRDRKRLARGAARSDPDAGRGVPAVELDPGE